MMAFRALMIMWQMCMDRLNLNIVFKIGVDTPVRNFVSKIPIKSEYFVFRKDLIWDIRLSNCSRVMPVKLT